MKAHPACAEALAKYRINPGNVGFKEKRDTQFSSMIDTALEYSKPVRIGVNWGSLDQELLESLMNENAGLEESLPASAVMKEALIRSVIDSAIMAESIGLPKNKIIVSCKVSDVQDLIEI